MELTVSEWVSITVAAGTALLAWATFSLARQTRKEAESTRRMAESAEREARAVTQQAGLTRASLQASVQPWLTRVTPPIHQVIVSPRSADEIFQSRAEREHVVYVNTTPDQVRVRLWLRNVGRGVALIRSGEGCVIEGPGPNDELVRRYGFPSAAALPPGESTRISFWVQHVDIATFLNMNQGDGEFRVKILYTDVNTQQPVWANVHLTARDASATVWLFHRIEYTRDGEDEPFATVTFDAGVESGPDEPSG